MKKFLPIIFILFFNITSFAQYPPNSWKDYFSYNTVKKVMQIGDSVVALSKNGLFIYNIQTSETLKFSKINGLSTVDLTTMAYNTIQKKLIIGYADGCIDIIQFPDFEITKIPTISKRSIYGSKAIRDICFSNDTAYFATDFGIVSMNLENLEFIHTIILGTEGENIPVRDIDIDNSKQIIYAATTKGIYYCSLYNNLSDALLWETLQNIPYANEDIALLSAYNNSLYYVYKNSDVTIQDSIYKITNNIATAFPIQLPLIQQLSTQDTALIVTSFNRILILNTAENLLFDYPVPSTTKQYSFKYSFIINSDSLWIADNFNGIFTSTSKKSIFPEGPFSNLTSEVQYRNDKLYVALGDSKAYQLGMFNILIGNTWYGHLNWDVKNSSSIYAVKNSDAYYYGTVGWGLVECSGIWKFDSIYNKTNSPIQNIYNDDSPYEQIPDITMDSNGNLWFLNKGVNYPLIVKTATNSWYSFNFSGLSSGKTVERILIDKNGYKWITGDTKVIVFTENNSIDNLSDDEYVLIPLIDDEGSIADRSTCVAEDIDGTIWIGTTQGIAIHSSSSQVFGSKKSVSRIKIEIDGEVGYLLSTEKITAITIDGANRKWIGTANSGIFLISPDGTQQILNFTISNSKLPSNTITSIAINHKTGEVFIGTESGLVSYISDATIGSASMEDITVFPNPVREDYTGNIYIRGTVTNAIIKITDISGNLVNESIANGGVGVWDGTNLQGERVATGIYLIYLSDEEGKETRVTKLLFIK